MKKMAVSCLMFYLLGNVFLAIEDAFLLKIHLGVDVNVAPAAALLRYLGGMSFGHWMFVFTAPFWLVLVIFSRKMTVRGLFSFVGAFVLAEFIDAAIWVFRSVDLTASGRWIAVALSVVFGGIGIAFFGLSRIPATPVVFVQIELSSAPRARSGAVRWLRFSTLVSLTNYLLLVLAFTIGGLHLHQSGAAGALDSLSLWGKGALFFLDSGIGVATLATALLLGPVVGVAQKSILSLCEPVDHLKKWHIDMDFDLLSLLRRRKRQLSS